MSTNDALDIITRILAEVSENETVEFNLTETGRIPFKKVLNDLSIVKVRQLS